MKTTFALVHNNVILATGLSLDDAHRHLVYIADAHGLALHLHPGGWEGHTLSTAYPAGADSWVDAVAWVRRDR